MVTFGILSSVFDYLTFGVLLLFLHSSEILFRTGWFVESVVSATLIVLVIRSRRPFFKSVPGRHLVIATLAIVGTAVILPFTPLGELFGFAPPPVSFILVMAAIVGLYILSGELAKRIFYRRVKF
jgi:Mg2+-importing ATPase